MDMGKMLPNLQFSVMCDDVIQDARTGRITLHGIFDRIGAKNFPARHGKLFIVNRWCNGDGEFIQNSRILSPKKTVLVQDKVTKFTLSDTRAKHSVIGEFKNILLHEPGVYWVEVYLEGGLALSYPFEVRKI